MLPGVRFPLGKDILCSTTCCVPIYNLSIQLGADPPTHPLQMALWGMLFGCIVVAVKASHPSAELTVNLKMAGAVLSVPVVLVGVLASTQFQETE